MCPVTKTNTNIIETKFAARYTSRKKIYYQDYFERHKTNMKKTWERINDVLYRRKKTKIVTAIKDINKSNKIVKEPPQVANILNDHFSSVGNRLARTIPTPQNIILITFVIAKHQFHLFYQSYRLRPTKCTFRYSPNQTTSLMVYIHLP